MPPVATAIVPLAEIGPPVGPAPVATLVTVPPLLVSTSDPQLQPPPLHLATWPPAHARPPIVAAFAEKRERGEGVSGCGGVSVVKAPPEAPGRAAISSHRPLPENAPAPKSRITANKPLATAMSSLTRGVPTGAPPLSAVKSVKRRS